MDVAVAILYCKHSNSMEKFSDGLPEASDFEILLEDNFVPSISGGSFVPSDDSTDNLRITPCSFSSSSSNCSNRIVQINGRRSPLLSRENLNFKNQNQRSISPRTSTKIGSSPQSISDSGYRSSIGGIDQGPQKLMRNLPRKAISFDQEPSEVASILACKLFSNSLSNDKNNNSAKLLFRRAVPVALWRSEPSSPCSAGILPIDFNQGNQSIIGGHSAAAAATTTQNLMAAGLSAALFCVPILDKEKITCSCSSSESGFESQYSNAKNPKLIENDNDDYSSVRTCSCRYRFHSFDKILSMCRNASVVIDPETRHLMLRLDEWLKVRSKHQNQFLSNLFVRPSASSRFRSCVHNPAHKNEICQCQNQSQKQKINTRSSNRSPPDYTTEIAEEVRSANTALACMMAVEKCDRFVMNPLFGSGLPYRLGGHRGGQQLSPNQYQYAAKNRPEPSILRRSPLTSGSQLNADGSDSGSFVDDFPLHRASQVGQASILRSLLAQHYDVNQLDRDSWAPIHYASWYGQLAAVQVLINYGQNCSVNIRNKNGSTALHFAAWCGHQYVVELLLSHPDIDPDLRDKDGKTALELCECVPKPEWQAVAELLRSTSLKKRHQSVPKIQVDLMDGSNAMLSLTDGVDTIADQLHAQMCRELQLSDECGKLFALWICSESLHLQLRGDHKPMQHLQKWKSKLWQWSDIADSADYDEEARLVFRRDARIGLTDEKNVKLTDTALALLFHEAHQNFLRGVYPCGDHDVVMLAATVMQIIHGEYDSKRDKLFLSNEKNLAKILPGHKLKDKNFNWIQHIMSEHKHLISSKSQNSLPSLQYRYLSFCEKFRLYGSAFFTALMFVDKPVKGALYVHAGINDAGLHLINCETKALYRSFEFANLAFTFQSDRPFIKFRGKDNGSTHEFTLKTKQASMINTLLSRFADQKQQKQKAPSASSPSPSPSSLSEKTSVTSGSSLIRR